MLKSYDIWFSFAVNGQIYVQIWKGTFWQKGGSLTLRILFVVSLTVRFLLNIIERIQLTDERLVAKYVQWIPRGEKIS